VAEKYVFWPMAVLSLGSAIGMLISRNAVHSALMLVLNFFTLAIFYVLLDAHFLAAAQVIVYAGAIMVLFLFVIMLLGVDREEQLDESIRFQRPLVAVFGLAMAGLLVYTLRTAFSGARFTGLARANSPGNVEAVGRALYTKYTFPFEVTSILLIVAAIGVMVVARRRGDEEPPPPGERLETPTEVEREEVPK
jgi:NADH-quinone oxidoreductase subunit J